MVWRTFSPTRTFVGQASLFILCLGFELVTKLAFSELDCMPKSFRSVVPMFGTVQNSPSHLRCCWLKLKAHVLPVLKILNMHPWKIKIIKLCFLTYVKRARAKILLEEYKKRSKKQWLKNMLYPNIADLIKIKMSRMKAAIRCAFKHW